MGLSRLSFALRRGWSLSFSLLPPGFTEYSEAKPAGGEGEGGTYLISVPDFPVPGREEPRLPDPGECCWCGTERGGGVFEELGGGGVRGSALCMKFEKTPLLSRGVEFEDDAAVVMIVGFGDVAPGEAAAEPENPELRKVPEEPRPGEPKLSGGSEEAEAGVTLSDGDAGFGRGS